MKTLIAVISATLLSAAAMAGAGDDKSKADAATFDALDKNADQQISRTEASGEKMLSESFAAIDSNGDGYISKSEFVARTKS